MKMRNLCGCRAKSGLRPAYLILLIVTFVSTSSGCIFDSSLPAAHTIHANLHRGNGDSIYQQSANVVDNTGSILIVERDTLQSRNLTPVINHAALVVNLSSQKISLDIHSPVPIAMDKSGPFWPRFGTNSLIAPPLFSENIPNPPQIHKYEFLEKPVRVVNKKPAYMWELELEPNHAAVAQYDNYYGLPEHFISGPGTLQILGLQILSHYQARQKGNDISMSIILELRNTGRCTIHNLCFRFCFPERIVDLNTHTSVRLFKLVKYQLTDSATYIEVGHADGFGNRVTLGHAAAVLRNEFKPDEEISFVFEIQGKRVARKCEIYPAYLVKFKEFGAERIWPKTEVFLEEKTLRRNQNYYRESNLIIPAARCFLLTDEGIDVVDPKSVKPTCSLSRPGERQENSLIRR